MPSEKRMLLAKSRLHQILMQKMIVGCRDDVIRAFMNDLEPTDLKLNLDAGVYEEVDEDDERNVRWMDSYDAEDVPEYPVFTLEGWYRPKKRIRRTDNLNLSVTLDIESGLIAEALASMQKKWRKTVANAIIAAYVRDNEYLQDVIEDENDDREDETGDGLHFDEFKERQREIQEIQSLMNLRREIIDGLFGILPELPFVTDEDLRTTQFPDELDERGIQRPEHWKHTDASSTDNVDD